jgi:hypothetical protein
MSPQPLEADFGIEIDFQSGTDAPSRVFKAMTALIDAFQIIDRELANSVAKIEPVLLLEDIETGSIKTWLKTQLESLDDQSLKSGEWKKVLGIFLVRAKYIIIDYLSDKATISSKGELEELQGKLLEAAKQTDILSIPTYRPMPLEHVADSIRMISLATQPLKESDLARYLSSEGNIDFNLSFRIKAESFDAFIVREIITNQTTLILKVKKPDFLGDSRWEFRHENHAMEVGMADFEWLQRFRQRAIVLRPGDAIKALVETSVKYSFEGEVIGTTHTILKVLEIISVENASQDDLFS